MPLSVTWDGCTALPLVCEDVVTQSRKPCDQNQLTIPDLKVTLSRKMALEAARIIFQNLFPREPRLYLYLVMKTKSLPM